MRSECTHSEGSEEEKFETFSTVWISDLASLSLPVDTIDIYFESLISDRTF